MILLSYYMYIGIVRLLMKMLCGISWLLRKILIVSLPLVIGLCYCDGLIDSCNFCVFVRLHTCVCVCVCGVSFEKRLLQPGANTSDIITQYISSIKVESAYIQILAVSSIRNVSNIELVNKGDNSGYL